MKKLFRSLFAITMVVLMVIAFSSCTENARVKTFGGEATINLDSGQSFVNATWKNDDMWIVTRERREGEAIETYKFFEKSSFGMMEGTYTIMEH
jgi:uncharacterized lipoprotein YehR (DUF1307 family)